MRQTPRNPPSLRALLLPGAPLDPGRVVEAVRLVEQSPRRFASLIQLAFDPNAGLANRAADAVERITRKSPGLAQSWKEPLLGLLADAREKKLRWNLALIVPRLRLTPQECGHAAAVLHGWLDHDPSSLVKTCALHGLADLARQDAKRMPEVLDLLRAASRSGTAAMRARARILLRRLEAHSPGRPPQNSLHLFD